MNKKIVIIGAGPTGLGAAYRLQELGYKNWQIYEKNPYIGGLASSFKDNEGFTWDIGGHVIFSHYEYFDKLFEKLLHDNYLQHERKAYVWIMDRWVPYPFQNNIRYLPKEKILECLAGLIAAQRENGNPSNFKEWTLHTFGQAIAKYFMFPQNWKMWAHPLEMMDKNWIAERISVIDLNRVLRNIIYSQDDVSWGANNKFKFPLYGGTGEVFQKFAPYIRGHLHLKKEVTEADLKKEEIAFSDGQRTDYDILINTMPLDQFVKMAHLSRLIYDVKKLKHNSIFLVGIGIKKNCPSNKSWMYFPEGNCPFYRITYFSNYSPNHVPCNYNNGYYSLMAETAYSEYREVSQNIIIDETIQGMVNSNLISEEDKNLIVTTYLIDAPYAYPVPILDRDKVLRKIQLHLMKNNIYSRGRFGAWKYEIGNMDHSVMQGVEVVNKLLLDENEKVWSL